MPGVSRSGITITAGRFLGLDRDSAARALVLPARADRARGGAAEGGAGRRSRRPAAGLDGAVRRRNARGRGSGLLAIDWLLGYVRRHDYSIFVWYRLIAAAVVILLILTGARSAGF